MFINVMFINVMSSERTETYRLVGTIDRDVKVLGLSFSEGGELDVELSDMGTGNFLIQLLGEHVDAQRELFRSGPECNLGQDLVGEGARHDERGVTGCTSNMK